MDEVPSEETQTDEDISLDQISETEEQVTETNPEESESN